MPKFLSLTDIIIINQNLIKDFGGLHAIRDNSLLESAAYAPQSTFDSKYLYPTIYEMAAAYAYHIIKNHPFVDGNKRTGLMTMLVFLESNKKQVYFKSNKLYNLGIEIATSSITIRKIALLLKNHSA